MKHYPYIIFDLDGTLTDSGPGVMNAVTYALERFGVEVPDRQALRAFVGPPLRESFQRFGGLSPEKAEEAILVFREYYEPTGIFENSVYPGMEATLGELKAAGRTLAVATSKLDKTSYRVLDHFGLSSYFDVVVGSRADGTLSEKAEVLACALARLGADAGEALMVGDRKYDVEGAAENGVACMGVLYGYGGRDELLSAGAICLAETPADIARLILEG